jgi:tetratricopeptide (TPR) repeat protein
MMLADALNTAGDKAGAIKTFERAAALLPTANGLGNPHAYIARIAVEQKDTDRAIRAYEAVLQIDNADVESARKLARCSKPRATRRAPKTRTGGWWRRSVRQRGQTALGRLALRRKDTTSRAARVPERAGHQAAGRGGCAHRPRRSASHGGASGRREARHPRRARDRPVVRTGAGSAAEDHREPGRRER